MYNYNYDYDYGAAVGLFGTILLQVWLITIGMTIFSIICNWKIYKKAGKEGWETIVPIYNFIVLLQIVELPLWYIALLLVPFVQIYVLIKVEIELAKKFGKSVGFGIGLILLNPIFIAILAFSKDANYVGKTSSQQQPYYSQQNHQPNQYNQYNQQSNQPVQYSQENIQPIESPNLNSSAQQPSTFCANCGTKLESGAKFCTNCGKQL